jgi:hypothetical protein
VHSIAPKKARRGASRADRSRRRRLRAGIAIVVLVLGRSTAGWSQELHLTGPLRGASGRLRSALWREGRFALSPLGGVAIAAREATAIAGAEALYHPVDAVGVGAWTVAALGPPSATSGGHDVRSIVAPQLVLVPLEGRSTTLFDSVWLPPYDVHLDLGAAWVARREGGEGRARSMIGVGFTSFFASFMSFGMDYRVVGDGTWQVFTASLTYWPGERHRDEGDEGDEP